MRNAVDVHVQPWFNPEYYSYIWQGVRDVFGESRIRLTTDGFPHLRDDEWYQPRDTFACRVNDRSIFVSANDHTGVNRLGLAWSDVYGKVNVSPADKGQLESIGPIFGIRAWGIGGSARLASRFAATLPPRRWAYRQLLATLRRQSRRVPITHYWPAHAASSASVFYVATYWARHPATAGPRASFLRATRRVLGVDRVAGGLIANGGDLPPTLEDVSGRSVTQQEFVVGTRESLLTFNNPAVHGCLGWKLGEFLALGKAIITVPVTNWLPAPLVHGEHWHVLEDASDEAMEHAVKAIATDSDYRHHLEESARRYYEEELTPARVVKRLLLASGVELPADEHWS